MQESKYKIGDIVRLKEINLIFQVIGVVLEEREYQYKIDNYIWYAEDAIEGIAIPAFKKGDKVIHKNKEGVFLVDDMIYDKEFHSWRYWFEDCFESTVEEFLKLYVEEIEIGSIVKLCKDYYGVVIQVRVDGSCIVLWSDGTITLNSDRTVKETATGQKIKRKIVERHLKCAFSNMTFNDVDMIKEDK